MRRAYLTVAGRGEGQQHLRDGAARGDSTLTRIFRRPVHELKLPDVLLTSSEQVQNRKRQADSLNFRRGSRGQVQKSLFSIETIADAIRLWNTVSPAATSTYAMLSDSLRDLRDLFVVVQTTD